MPSEFFYCPKCNWRSRKSDKAYVMGEILQGDADSMMLGDAGASGETVTCPRCHSPIDAQRLLKGEYDGKRYAGHNTLALGSGIVAWAVACYALHAPWWGGLKIGRASCRERV